MKEGTSAAWLQSGLDNEWWADSMECYTYLRNNSQIWLSLMRRRPMKDALRQPFEGPETIWFIGRISPYFCEKAIWTALIRPKSLARKNIIWICVARKGESGKETLRLQTLKNWRRWTHQNSTPEGSMQRKY